MTEQLKNWWASLSDREQKLSLLSAAFLLLAIIYWGAWKPLATQIDDSKRQLNNAQQTLSWVEEKSALLVQSGASPQRATSQPLTLQQLVSSSAKQYAIKFSRIENKKEQIEVVIADAEFDQLIRWLTTLTNQYYISVISADISKIEPQGHIKVNRLVLSN